MTDKQYLTLLSTMVGIGETLGARIDKHDARFDAIDARLDTMDRRFDAMDARFDAMDSRFDAMDARFDAMDSRFKTVDKNFAEIHEILLDFAQTSHDLTSETKVVQKKHDTRLCTLEKRLTAKLS